HAGPVELQRFRVEAEAVASLQHPNIVQVYEVAEHNGCPFIALEYVDGASLGSKLASTPLPARQAAQLIATLAAAVHFAHQHQVVHRDLKPDNVLLTADGSPKITDFRLANKFDEGAAPTQTGDLRGTPNYMAPEQAEGRSHDIGPLSDVYALGAILYEMLTSRPPFNAESSFDTVLQVINEEPVPPSRLRPKLPR